MPAGVRAQEGYVRRSGKTHSTAANRGRRSAWKLEGGGALDCAISACCNGLKTSIPIDYVGRDQHGRTCRRILRDGKEPDGKLKQIVEAGKDWDFFMRWNDGRNEDLSYRRKEDSRTFQNRSCFGLKTIVFGPPG